MKICTKCHDEYRDDIETCFRCDVALVDHASGIESFQGSKAETIDPARAVKVIEGSLPGCKEVESLLKQRKIPCLLVPVQTGNAINYAVCVDESRVQDFAKIMESRFSDMVQREHAKDWASQEVNLDAGDVTCPACGHVGALNEGSCADCGLMLGVSEPS